jgi:hypothetical protein
MQNTKESSRFTTQQNYNTLENVKHIVKMNARHITKESKKKKNIRKFKILETQKPLNTLKNAKLKRKFKICNTTNLERI